MRRSSSAEPVAGALRTPDVGTRGSAASAADPSRWESRAAARSRPNAIDDGAQIRRLVALWLTQLASVAATAPHVCAHDDGEPVPKTSAANSTLPPVTADDIAGDADDEQVAEACRNQLCGTRESEQPSTMANGLRRPGTTSDVAPFCNEARLPSRRRVSAS